MAVTLKEVEAIPTEYPTVTGLSDKAAALDADALWQRIEAYCRVRWTDRQVIWTVEGEGEWEAPLQPATLTMVEVWESGAWGECTPAASPWGGYDLPGDGPYRITSDVGGGDVPAAVLEAFRRLAEYSVEMTADSMVTGHPSITSHSVSIGDAIDESFRRPTNWTGKALDMSGAADLLRPYKRRW